MNKTGYYVNNTVCLLPVSDPWLVGVLNAPIGWWFAWRAAQHGKDEALRYFNTFVESYPVPSLSEQYDEVASMAVSRLSDIQHEAANTRAELSDWYRLALEIHRPHQQLLNPFSLTADEFIEQARIARGKRRPLPAAAVHELREGYASIVRPVQAALREAERLERRLSDLVNEAYGLTPDEVRLMWATAPPRMPLTPGAGTLSPGEPVSTHYDAAE